jgi:LmbE family N-acetylglucosaminyl deacetylase
MTIIELPDDQATALSAKAAAAGMSLSDWLKQLSGVEAGRGAGPLRQIAEAILETMRDVPPDVVAAIPEDGASQHDHYIYGWPKRDV